MWLFRWQAAAVLVTTTAVCVLADWLCLKLRGRGFDGSGAVTGLLLGLSLPAGTALWAAALASVFAVAVVKQLPGGIGRNLFNRRWPAVRCCWLLCRRRWAATCARTPYLRLRRSPSRADTSLWPLFLGYENGSLGETSALLILVGMVYLWRAGSSVCGCQ